MSYWIIGIVLALLSIIALLVALLVARAQERDREIDSLKRKEDQVEIRRLNAEVSQAKAATAKAENLLAQERFEHLRTSDALFAAGREAARQNERIDTLIEALSTPRNLRRTGGSALTTGDAPPTPATVAKKASAKRPAKKAPAREES